MSGIHDRRLRRPRNFSSATACLSLLVVFSPSIGATTCRGVHGFPRINGRARSGGAVDRKTINAPRSPARRHSRPAKDQCKNGGWKTFGRLQEPRATASASWRARARTRRPTPPSAGRARPGDTGRAMSQENVEVVRHSLELATDSRRRLEERLALRVPYIQRLVARLWWKRPPQSRLRQAILPRLVRSGFEAANRRDFEVAFANYDPDVSSSRRRAWSDLVMSPFIAVSKPVSDINGNGTPNGGSFAMNPTS